MGWGSLKIPGDVTYPCLIPVRAKLLTDLMRLMGSVQGQALSRKFEQKFAAELISLMCTGMVNNVDSFI